MTLTDSQRAGAAATVVAVLTALAYGTLYTRAPQPTDVLVRSTVLVSDDALPALGVAVVAYDDGGRGAALSSSTPLADGGVAILAHGGLPLTGSSYWRVAICAPEVDGGHDPGQSFLGASVTVVYDDDEVGPCVDGGPVIEAWQQGRVDAPFPCACARVDAGCLRPDGGPAPVLDARGNPRTLNPGEWAGSACTPKACVEIAGVNSMPEACR